MVIALQKIPNQNTITACSTINSANLPCLSVGVVLDEVSTLEGRDVGYLVTNFSSSSISRGSHLFPFTGGCFTITILWEPALASEILISPPSPGFLNKLRTTRAANVANGIIESRYNIAIDRLELAIVKVGRAI